jgi:hypothetical protein
MKNILKIRSLLICLCIIYGFNINAAESIGSKNEIRGGTCAPVVFTPPTLGSTLSISNGSSSCVLDIYQTSDDCSMATDNTGLTFLGTFTLDTNGQINTGIPIQSVCYVAIQSASTTPIIGRMYVPVNNTDVTSTQATIGSNLVLNLDFTGTDGAIIYNGTTIVGLPVGVFNGPIASGAVTSIATRANGFDGFGSQIFSEINDTLDFIAPSCTSVTQDPDSTVTAVDIGTVISLNLTSSGAISAFINGVSMTPATDPNTNNSVDWVASYTAIEDAVVSATITNPNGEQANCQWMIDVNCADPTFNSIAPVGEVGIVISGTPGCEHIVSVTTPDLTVTEYSVVIGNNGLGDLNIVVPANSLLEVGSDSIMTGPLPNTAPVASSVGIAGVQEVGNALTGQYTYSDGENDLEGQSIYQWYRNGTPINAANSLSYQLIGVDSGTTISFEVTPVAQTGDTLGIAVVSAGVFIGVISVPTFTTGFLIILLSLITWIGFRKIKYNQ